VTRRPWIVAGAVGAVAALAGVGGALWRERRGASEAPAMWALRFERPSGGEIVMADLRGRPLVVNFWATWCPPCVREMPALDRFHREHAGRGWQVLGLAVDNRGPVQDFLRRQPVGFEIGMAGLDGIELSRQLGNDGGGLPFTVVFDGRGRIIRRKSGETTFDELAAWARGS
jgi:thiol-disulfide isomerase/thioredoxin